MSEHERGSGEECYRKSDKRKGVFSGRPAEIARLRHSESTWRGRVEGELVEALRLRDGLVLRDLGSGLAGSLGLVVVSAMPFLKPY